MVGWRSGALRDADEQPWPLDRDRVSRLQPGVDKNENEKLRSIECQILPTFSLNGTL